MAKEALLNKIKKNLSQSSKKSASKKISKPSPVATSGNLGKKRIGSAGSTPEDKQKLVITKKDFEQYIEMVRQEERNKGKGERQRDKCKRQMQKARGKRQETKAKGKRQRDKCKRQKTNSRGKR